MSTIMTFFRHNKPYQSSNAHLLVKGIFQSGMVEYAVSSTLPSDSPWRNNIIRFGSKYFAFSSLDFVEEKKRDLVFTVPLEDENRFWYLLWSRLNRRMFVPKVMGMFSINADQKWRGNNMSVFTNGAWGSADHTMVKRSTILHIEDACAASCFRCSFVDFGFFPVASTCQQSLRVFAAFIPHCPLFIP